MRNAGGWSRLAEPAENCAICAAVNGLMLRPAVQGVAATEGETGPGASTAGWGVRGCSPTAGGASLAPPLVGRILVWGRSARPRDVRWRSGFATCFERRPDGCFRE